MTLRRGMMAQGTGGGAVYSPWDVSSLPANVTASDSDFTLTRSGGTDGAVNRIVLHPVKKNTGKWALRFLCQRTPSTSHYAVVGMHRTGTIGANLGGGADSWGAWCGASTVSGNRAWHNSLMDGPLPGGPWVDGTALTEVMLEINLTGGVKHAWWGINGTWLGSADPLAGTSPHFTSLTGDIGIAADMYNDSIVQLLEPSDFITPATAGFTPGWPD